MSNQDIPERQPISDKVTGVISQFDNHYILSSQSLPSAQFVAEGDFIIRYGIPYLGKPHYSIVPDLVVLDYGHMLVSEEAWDFLIKQSNLYPRSDVLGYRNDGTDEMLVIKQLDFAVPFDVLVYESEAERKPFAQLQALITDESNYPERLLDYLTHYSSIEDWQVSDE